MRKAFDLRWLSGTAQPKGGAFKAGVSQRPWGGTLAQRGDRPMQVHPPDRSWFSEPLSQWRNGRFISERWRGVGECARHVSERTQRQKERTRNQVLRNLSVLAEECERRQCLSSCCAREAATRGRAQTPVRHTPLRGSARRASAWPFLSS